MMYLIEVLSRDEAGEISEMKVKFKTDSRARPKGRDVFLLHGPDVDNPKVLKNENGFYIVNDTDLRDKKLFEKRISLKIKRQDFGRRLIAIISDRNDSKDLSTPDVVALSMTYANIERACLNGSINTVKDLITAATPDGTIVTTDDKNILLSEINSNLKDLGYE